MDDIELAPAGGQMTAGAQREGQRFGEAAGPHRGDFECVDPVAVLAALRRPERVGLPVEVETAEFGERDAVVEDGVGLGADDLDAVPETGQLA